MAIAIQFPDLAATLKGHKKKLARAFTLAMNDTVQQMKDAERQSLVDAGFSKQFSYVWQGLTYPYSKQRKNPGGKFSLNPAGEIYVSPPTKPTNISAPGIIESMIEGAEIRPIRGSKYLAISVNKIRRGKGTPGMGQHKKRETVADTEARLGEKITIVKGRNGHLLGFFSAAKQPKAIRQRRGYARKRDMVLYFVFVPLVKMPRKIPDPVKIANGVWGNITAHLDERIARERLSE